MDMFTGVRHAQGSDQNDRAGTGSRSMSADLSSLLPFSSSCLFACMVFPTCLCLRSTSVYSDLSQVFPQVCPDSMVVSPNLLLPSQIPEGVSCTRRRSPRDQLLIEAKDGERRQSGALVLGLVSSWLCNLTRPFLFTDILFSFLIYEIWVCI